MGSSTSNPKVTIALSPAAIVDAFEDRRDIIFGQVGPLGASVDGALNVDVHTFTTAEIKTLFGDDSFLTNYIQSWLDVNEGQSPLDVISKDESGTGVAGTGVLTFGGAATSDGEYKISFIDERQYQVTVIVESGDDLTDVGDTLAAEIAALDDPIFSVVNAVGVVTATAKDKGTVSNDYGIKVEGSVPGLTTAITPWSGGLNDPILTGILDAIEGIRYTGAMWPESWVENLSIIKDEFESRFNPSNAIMDGTVFHGLSDTFANIKSTILAENSQVIVMMGSNKLAISDQSGPAVLRPADFVAAEFAGIRARRLTPDAPIADYIITTSGRLDSFGGPSLASLPYFNTPLRRTPVTPSVNLFTRVEQNELEEAGFTTYGVNDAQNFMIMGPAATNYTTDAGGNANVSFHFLNYMDTGSACREIFYRVLKSTYAQSRLTEGDLIAGRSMTNADAIKAELLRIYRFLALAGLTQKGREASAFFATETTVTTEMSTGIATVDGPLPLVTQLRGINYALQFSFAVGGTGTQITV